MDGYTNNKGDQVLNSNMRYLTLYSKAWDDTDDFSSKIHFDPTPFLKSGLLLYVRFDTFRYDDFYLKATTDHALEYKNLQVSYQ